MCAKRCTDPTEGVLLSSRSQNRVGAGHILLHPVAAVATTRVEHVTQVGRGERRKVADPECARPDIGLVRIPLREQPTHTRRGQPKSVVATKKNLGSISSEHAGDASYDLNLRRALRTLATVCHRGAEVALVVLDSRNLVKGDLADREGHLAGVPSSRDACVKGVLQDLTDDVFWVPIPLSRRKSREPLGLAGSGKNERSAAGTGLAGRGEHVVWIPVCWFSQYSRRQAHRVRIGSIRRGSRRQFRQMLVRGAQKIRTEKYRPHLLREPLGRTFPPFRSTN